MNIPGMVVDAVRNAAKHAEQDYYQQRQTFAVCLAKADMWKHFNPGSSGCVNPYQPESLESSLRDTRDRYDSWREAYDLTVDTFLGDSNG